MPIARNNEVFVLLARGFEEADVSTVTRTLRRSGFSVAIVGLTAGPVRGAYGLSLAPDWALSEVEGDLPQGVVLPGGVQGTRRFAADPRVHNLLRRVTGHGGYVLALDTAYMVVRSAGILDARGPRSHGGPGEGPAARERSEWDGENALLVTADHAPSQRVLLESQVVFGRDSGAAQEAALTLASLLGESMVGAR